MHKSQREFHKVMALRNRWSAAMLITICTISLASSASWAKVINGAVIKDDQDQFMIIRFRAIFDTEVSTKDACEGDKVEAHVNQDVKIGNRILAPSGSIVIGHVESVTLGRGLARSMASRTNRFHQRGSVVVQFDRIVTPRKIELPIDGLAAEQRTVFSNRGKYKRLQVGEGGEIQKLESLDLWQSSDFDVIIPESLLKMGSRQQVEIEPGDQLEVRAKLRPEDLTSFYSASSKVQSASEPDEVGATRQSSALDGAQ